jgi:hypothetical protein
LNVSQAIANAQLLFNKLKEIVDKFDGKVITMTTNWKTTGSPPSTAEGHRTGARIPGYGGGDTVPALLEKGEWIIRKEAVKKYGNNFLAMLNAGMLKAGSMIPRFATGGSVENSNWFQEFKKAYQQKGYSGFGLEEQIWMDRNNGSNPREFVERFIEWLRHFQRRQVDDISFRYGKLNWFDRSWTENYPTEVIPESLRTGPFKPTNIASYIRNMIDWYGYQGAEFLSKGGLVGGLRNIGSLAGSLSSSLMGGVPRGFKTGGLVDAMSGGSSVVSPSYTGRVDFSFGGQTHSMYADSNVARDLVLTLNKMKRRVS